MFCLKMQDFLFGLLSFLCSLKGLTCSKWAVNVQTRVNGSMGQNVILPCNFTHPKQDTYTGSITVKWTQKMNPNHPVTLFYCSLRNKTDGQDHNCSDPRSRFWLYGNPRKGDISLGIKNSQFIDSKGYNCRVELDYDSYNSIITALNITAPAQILSLSLDSGATTMGEMLKCIAQGKPVPTVKWTSLNGSLGHIQNSKTDHSNYTVISSIPFSGQGVYTCQAENSLGRAERTFPPNHQNDFVPLVWISAVGCLLFFGLFVAGGVVLRRRGRSPQRSMPQKINANLQTGTIYMDQANDAPIYANFIVGERRLPPEIPVSGLNEPNYGHTTSQHTPNGKKS